MSPARCRYCGVEREFGNSEEAVLELSPKRGAPHYQGREALDRRPMGKWPSKGMRDEGEGMSPPRHGPRREACELCGRVYQVGGGMTGHRTRAHGVRSR